MDGWTDRQIDRDVVVVVAEGGVVLWCVVVSTDRNKADDESQIKMGKT